MRATHAHGKEHRIETFSRLRTQLTSHGRMKCGARLKRANRGKKKEIEGTEGRVGDRYHRLELVP